MTKVFVYDAADNKQWCSFSSVPDKYKAVIALLDVCNLIPNIGYLTVFDAGDGYYFLHEKRKELVTP